MVIGIDTHKREHVLVAVDQYGYSCDVQHLPNTPEGWRAALAWARSQSDARTWGIENSRSLGKGLAQFLLGQGEATVLEVCPQRTAQYRRHGRTQHKTDEADAVAFARLLLAVGDRLPAVHVDDVSTELRLLSGYRDNLLNERTQLTQSTPRAGAVGGSEL